MYFRELWSCSLLTCDGLQFRRIILVNQYHWINECSSSNSSIVMNYLLNLAAAIVIMITKDHAGAAA